MDLNYSPRGEPLSAGEGRSEALNCGKHALHCALIENALSAEAGRPAAPNSALDSVQAIFSRQIVVANVDVTSK